MAVGAVWLSIAAGSTVAIAVGATLAAAATVSPQACLDPLAETHNFTVVVEENAALGSTGAGGEIEGSLAAGGNVSFGLYNLLDNSDGSALPSVGSPTTQLLVGGTVDYASGQKLDLNAGFGKITDTSGLNVTPDGRLILDDPNRYVKSQFGAGQDSVSNYTAAAGTFREAFPDDYFHRLRGLSIQYAGLAEGDATTPVAGTGGGDLHLVLEEGKTNIWNVSAAELSGSTSVTFDAAKPSPATRLVINVTPDGSTEVGGLRFNGDTPADRYFAPWIVWNFQGWENLRLVGATEMSGMLLAPDAALEYNRSNPLRGQIIGKSINVTAAGEIHHWSYESAPCGVEAQVPTGTPTVTPAPVATETRPTVTETASPTPESTETARAGQAATSGPTSSASASVVVDGPEASAPVLAGTAEHQLAETGFDRTWMVAMALVLLLAGAAAVAVARIRQGQRTSGGGLRH